MVFFDEVTSLLAQKDTQFLERLEAAIAAFSSDFGLSNGFNRRTRGGGDLVGLDNATDSDFGSQR